MVLSDARFTIMIIHAFVALYIQAIHERPPYIINDLYKFIIYPTNSLLCVFQDKFVVIDSKQYLYLL